MKLYHGSYIKIDKIDLAKAKPYKDFGRAFYLTKFHKQAKNKIENYVQLDILERFNDDRKSYRKQETVP